MRQKLTCRQYFQGHSRIIEGGEYKESGMKCEESTEEGTDKQKKRGQRIFRGAIHHKT